LYVSKYYSFFSTDSFVIFKYKHFSIHGFFLMVTSFEDETNAHW